MTFDPKTLTTLAVSLHGRRVGTITRLAGDKQIFALEQDYIDDQNRPTLSLSLKGRSGGIVTAIRPVHRRVPPFFSNLLPEGNLRAYLAEQAGVNPEREFFLLAVLGADLTGAITVTTPDEAGGDRPRDDDRDDGADSRGDRAPQGVLRFSLAGVQLKFSAIRETSGSLTIPAQGIGGSWIVKLPSHRFAAVTENEFVMLELARTVGIPVPRLHLIPVKDIDGLPAEAAALPGNALAVERFDRGRAGQRIHMEDFAQVFGVFPEKKYTASYANIATVLWAETGEQGTFEFVKRLVFSVLIGNADMHLKNWSLLYPDGRTPVLSPAYDFVCTLPYIPGDTLALKFGGSKDIAGITADQIRRLSDTAGLPVAPLMKIVSSTVDVTVAAWQTLDAKSLLPADLVKAISTQIDASATRTAKAFLRS